MAAVIDNRIDPMIPVRYRIGKVRRETHDTFTLELHRLDGQPPLRFRPGQFNMLYLFGVGEVAISISGDPDDHENLVHTIRAVGTVTKSLEHLGPGEVIGVRGPYGRAWPVEESRGQDVVLVAGGIGLAPLRPVIHHLLARRADYGRIVLLYGTRSPADILFRRELERWRARLDLDILVTVDRMAEDWRGSVGLVTTLIGRAPFDPARATAMICGPEVMMRYTMAELLERGVASESLYLSMERNMKCAVGLCGHCQFGPTFICKDGPVFSAPEMAGLLNL
ncbi:MAG: FAD/NAD(P)-binding protein, partial [Acidobacteriota bacterium]